MLPVQKSNSRPEVSILGNGYRDFSQKQAPEMLQLHKKNQYYIFCMPLYRYITYVNQTGINLSQQYSYAFYQTSSID